MAIDGWLDYCDFTNKFKHYNKKFNYTVFSKHACQTSKSRLNTILLGWWWSATWRWLGSHGWTIKSGRTWGGY